MRLTVSIVFILLALLPAAATAADRVLIINSYHPGYPWSDQEQAAILAGLTAAMPDATILVEYLDTKHYPDEQHYAELAKLFRHKAAGHELQLVMTLDDPALVFVHKFRQEIFAGVPVVFAGINGYTPDLLRGDTLMTGVGEALDPAGTIRLMLQLQPDLREVLAINDSTRTADGTRRMLLAVWPEFAGRLQLKFAPDTSVAEAAAALAAMPAEGAAGLLMSYGSDRAGRAYAAPEMVPLLTAASKVPLYALHDNRLGYGVAGGMLLSATEHGKRAAALALRVLRGERAGDIPVDVSATAAPMFDEAVLRRFGLDADRLPAASTIINRPRSAWREHPRAMTGLLTAMLALFGLVLMLTLNIIRRRRAEKELRSLDEMKTNLLANVSHELRTPLVAIRGYSELIGEGMSGPVSELQREQLGVMIRNIDRLLELIDNLLDFSRLEFGAMRLHRQKCDLRDLARDAATTAMPRVRRAQLTLHTELGSEPVLVNGDPAKLMQVMNNLIDNAIKFTPPEGKIKVAVSAEARLARVVITDTGIGLTPESLPRIFDRFYQVDGGPTRRRGGTGIGLAIVREIALLHGGNARVKSNQGAGTTFTIELPCA